MSLSRYRQRARPYGNVLANFGTGMSLARFAYNNRNAIASRARQMAFSRSRRSAKRVTSGQGVTTQYDRKRVYSKRYMPRYKKRRWKRFKNKVQAVLQKRLGSTTAVFNNLIQSDLQMIAANSNLQQLVQLALYPIKQDTTPHLDDIDRVINQDARLTNTSKVMFCSGVLDITMRCQSILNTTPPLTGNPSLSMEIDVYEISMRGPTGQSGEAVDLVNAFNIGATDTSTIPGSSGTGLVPTNRGWTPFDANAALSQHGIKILKKTKYFLSNEQTATYQVRDPKTHYYSKDIVPGTSSANQPGMTKWILILWKPIPGYNYTAPPTNDILRLNVGFTRKYMYKINEDSTDFDTYQP